jgi:hypothetical protein
MGVIFGGVACLVRPFRSFSFFTSSSCAKILIEIHARVPLLFEPKNKKPSRPFRERLDSKTKTPGLVRDQSSLSPVPALRVAILAWSF